MVIEEPGDEENRGHQHDYDDDGDDVPGRPGKRGTRMEKLVVPSERAGARTRQLRGRLNGPK